MNAGFLTRKIGPLPAWAWGGILAVGVWWFFLRGKATAPGTGAQGTQGITPGQESIYGLGFAQGQQAAGAAQQPAATQTGPTVTVGNAQGPQGVPIWAYDPAHQGVIGYAQPGAQLPLVGPAVGFAGDPGYLVRFQAQTGFVSGSNAVAISTQGGGQGGPGTARKHAIGSRSANLWSDAHPAVGGPVRYPHYVRAVGGPGNHRREIARVAAQSGVHPARVAMLNPVHTGRIRLA